jgi:phthiodiolone/phenolphthiodiolone dimycocerosates ketoreductase
LHNAVFDLPPYKGKWPEIWVTAHAPRMLRATGRYADGWFPVVVFRPQDYAESLDVVRAAASDAGRDPMSITPATWFLVPTGRGNDKIDEALESSIMKAFTLNLPAETWTRHGARHPFGDDFSGWQDIIPQILDEETVVSSTKDAPKSLLKEAFLTGPFLSPKSCGTSESCKPPVPAFGRYRCSDATRSNRQRQCRS